MRGLGDGFFFHTLTTTPAVKRKLVQAVKLHLADAFD